MRNWVLEVEFEPLEVQVERDPENLFPNDEQTRFIHYLCERWDISPEELKADLIEWSGTTLRVFPEVLDQISEPIEWLLMCTIPVSIKLTR